MNRVAQVAFRALMPKSAARTADAMTAIREMKRAAQDRSREQDYIAGVASCGTACDLAASLQALSRKLAS